MKKRLGRKFVTLFLALAMVITPIFSAFPDTVKAKNGAADGQVEYVGGENSSIGAMDKITVSKTIEAVTGKENYFDITLKTIASKQYSDASVDVVIVMDISNTMDSTDTKSNVSKISQAISATNEFIKQFSENTEISRDRRVGVVTFNQHAQVAVPMQEANDINDYTTKFKSQVEAITIPREPEEIKFTNIEAGLQLASNILADTQSKYKFVILLTDGFPTTYVEKNRDSKTKINGYDTYMAHTPTHMSYRAEWIGRNKDGTLKKPGYMANATLGKVCWYGTDYSDYAAQRAQAVAVSMKANNINIFSVGIGIGSMSIAGYLELFKNSPFTTVDTNGMEINKGYTIGDEKDTDSYKNWLGNVIGGGGLLSDSTSIRYSSGDSVEQLAIAYSGILATMEKAPEIDKSEFYTLDPMSSVAEFQGFYDKDNNLAMDVNALEGKAEINGENTAAYGGTNNENRINWNLIKSGYVEDGDNLVYKLKYRVRLKNEISGFQWAHAYEMNEKTTLYYSKDGETSGIGCTGLGELDYPIPRAEGYKGSVKFQKIDEDTKEAMVGVGFTLQHKGDNCSVCTGDAEIVEVKITSDARGYVAFDNIPSGHEYVLIEDEPENYMPISERTVIVSCGDTYIDAKIAENKLVDGVFPARNNKACVITNKKVEPVKIKLKATKTVNSLVPTAAQKFSFQLIDADTGKVIETVQNNQGEIIFSECQFTEKGIYNFLVKEVIPEKGEKGFTYDKTEFTIQVVVTDVDDDGVLEKKVIVNGKEVSLENNSLAVGTFVNKFMEESKKPSNNTPATGDYSRPMYYAMAMLGAVGVAFLTVKEKIKIKTKR